MQSKKNKKKHRLLIVFLIGNIQKKKCNVRVLAMNQKAHA
jgi:hypothetical protein